MAEGKVPGLAVSSAPREPLTQIELLITLDRIQRDIKGIREDLSTAKSNDERFTKMEHDFRVAKWFTIVAGGAAIIALVNAFVGRVSWRYTEMPPAPTSNAERLGSERVPSVPAR